MANLNSVSLIGRLTKDVDAKHLPSGSAVANFSLAINEKYKDKNTSQYVEKTEFINISCFGSLAELCGKYISKGSMVYLSGKIKTDSYDKDGTKVYSTKVVANTVQFLDSKSDSQSNSEPTKDYKVSTDASFASDSIPF